MKKFVVAAYFLTFVCMANSNQKHHSLNIDFCADYSEAFSQSIMDYSFALTNYETEKYHYESACNQSYGYSAEDESACGRNGYVVTFYNERKNIMLSKKEDAKRNFDNMREFCDPLFTTPPS